MNLLTDLETAEVLNNLSNIVKNLDISRYSNDEPLVSNTNDATLKAVLKYRNHTSIIAIQNKKKDKRSFNFISGWSETKWKIDFKARRK